MGWQDQPYEIDPTVQLAQFSLEESNSETKPGISTRRDRGGFRNDSSVQLNFVFKRQTGFFLLQIYTPLTLIVFCSWVSFWLVKTEAGGEVPARTALGATTVLSIVNLGFGGKSKPKVGYATALDMYIILCMAAVFMALVEFACINFIDTFIKRFKKWEEEQKQLKENVKEEPPNGLVLKLKSENGKAVENEKIEEILITIENGQDLPAQILRSRSDLHIPTFAESESVSTISRQDACVSTEDDDFEDMEEEDESEQEEDRLTDRITECLDQVFEATLRRFFRKYSPLIPDMVIYTDTITVIHKIDDCARKGFPLFFLFLQAAYWTLYLHTL